MTKFNFVFIKQAFLLTTADLKKVLRTPSANVHSKNACWAELTRRRRSRRA